MSAPNDHDHHMLSRKCSMPPTKNVRRHDYTSSGLVNVLNHTPAEGEQGIRVTANINFTLEVSYHVRLRLVVGRRAIATDVRELSDQTNGKWQLSGIVPPFETLRTASPTVPLTVQLVDKDDTVLESVTFGMFTYWESLPIIAAKRAPEAVDAEDVQPPLSTKLPSKPPRSTRVARSKRHHSQVGYIKARHSNLGSARDRHDSDPSNDYRSKAVLELLSPLGRLAHHWDDKENRLGRRLVRFHRVQEGHCLKVSGSAITQEEYAGNINGDPVISCIRRRDGMEGCCITSVDVIYLLERLVDESFQVEEKNRIRRNLEGLRPKTISKHKAGSEDFFQRIMDFPAPKPRNIEKDVKVFDWDLLPQALHKIISKYTMPYDDADERVQQPSPVDVLNADEVDSSSSDEDIDYKHDPSTPTISEAPQLIYPSDPMYSPMYVDPTVFLAPSPPSCEIGLSFADSASFGIDGCSQRSDSSSHNWDMRMVKMEASDDMFPSFENAQTHEQYPFYNGNHLYESLEYQAFSEHQVEHAYSFAEYPIQSISNL